MDLEQENNQNEEGVEHWKNSSLLFARALGFLLQDDMGIVVNTVNDINLGEGIDKVIIFRQGGQVIVEVCTEDIMEGTPVKLQVTDNGQEG